MSRNFLVIDPAERPDVLRGLASPARARILRLLLRRPGLNVNDIAEALNLPQSTVSSNLQILESAGLIRTETQKGRKGNQKLCFSAFDEVLVMLRDDVSGVNANAIEVAMPIGLYTSCEVSAPCGLCSPKGASLGRSISLNRPSRPICNSRERGPHPDGNAKGTEGQPKALLLRLR